MAESTYEVTRRATINAPVAEIHGLVDDFREWQRWSPWEGMDPDQVRTYSGSDSGVGAVYEWRGNRKVGEGRMEIRQSTPDRVVVALDFLKPFKSSNTTSFELKDLGGTTEVTWRMVGPLTTATRIMGIFRSMDKMIGPDFERGLAQLAAATES